MPAARPGPDAPSPPRLKPDLPPVLRRVPEVVADPALRAICEETKAAFQVPWMGVVTMAFATCPTFWAELWRGLATLAASRAFVEACVALIQVFSHGSMPYLLTESLARLRLEGEGPAGGEGGGAAPFEGRHGPAAPGARLVLMEPRHASAETRALRDRARTRLGLALGQHQPLRPRPPAKAARQDAPEGEAPDVVRLFQWLLPGLIANVAVFRAQPLEPEEAS
jgi:hypothetical protein